MKTSGSVSAMVRPKSLGWGANAIFWWVNLDFLNGYCPAILGDHSGKTLGQTGPGVREEAIRH